MIDTYSTARGFLPRQRIPDSQKTDEWKIDNVRSVLGLAISNSQGKQRTTKQEKQINYDLFNGIWDETDFDYVTDPMGLNGKYGGNPSKMEGFNLTKSKIELLKGEEGARPFSWTVRGVGGNVLTIKTEQQRELMMNLLQSTILTNMGIAPGTKGDIGNLPQIQKYMDSEFMDPREVTANQVLKYLEKRDQLARKFNEGWEHGLLVAEEIYYIGIKDGHPHVRVVNPIAFEYDKDIDERFIEYGEWAREERWLHPSTVLDIYDEQLDDNEKDLIEQGHMGYSFNHGMQAGFAYQEGVSPDTRHFSNGSQNTILVSHVAWRSFKQVTFLTDLDAETGQWLTTLVEEGYKLSAEQKSRKAKIEKKYKPEIWIGTQIGNDIFVDIRPADVQNGKLPYVGYIYNSTNSVATSLMDLMKPHQYTYMIVWWKMMDEVAKSKGKKIEIDLAMLPKSHGVDLQKYLYYFNNADISFINSLEENGPQKLRTNRTTAFKEADMSMSQSMGQYIVILDKLKQEIEEITGINRQREGRTMASESATGNQQAVAGSSYITEPYFRYHNEVKKHVLESVLETAKVAYKDGKQIQFVVDEAYTQLIKIDGDEFTDSDYGLTVSDSSKDYQNMQKIEQLMVMAIQQKQADLLDAVHLYNANSLAEYEGVLEKSIKRKEQQAQEMEKAQLQQQQQQHQETMAWEREKEDRADARNTQDNKTALEIADKKNALVDKDRDGIPDSLEQGKVATAQMKVMSDQATKEKDLDIKAKKNDEDTSIKEEANKIKKTEVKSKIELEREKMEHEKKMVKHEEHQSLLEDQLKDKEFSRTIQMDNHKLKHEDKLADVKVKSGEKQLKVKAKEIDLKTKADTQKIKTTEALQKLKPKPTTKTTKK